VAKGAVMTLTGPSFEAIAREARDEAERYRPRLGILDEQLLAFITTHVTSETKMLAGYQATAAETPDEYVQYLLQLIIRDEQRHHQLLDEMANYLRAGIDGSDIRPRIPWLTRPKQPSSLRTATRHLIRAERHDRRELRRFRRRLGPLRKTTLLGVMIDSMRFDTEKHLLFLRAIRRSTRS
jgi:hypothetical protein